MGIADDLATGLATIRSQYGLTVTYSRDTDDIENLAAAVGRSTFEGTNNEGLITQAQVRDYLIAAAYLVISDAQIEPRPGDTIAEVIGTTTHTYEVVAPQPDEPCYSYSDPDKTQLRIHTKLRGTA